MRTTNTLTYDANGNITAIANSTTTNNSYDAINRLIASNNTAFSLAWSYDANGNRTSKVSGGVTTPYTIDTNSNKLLAVDTSNYQYDNNGSLIDDSAFTYQYDAQGRPAHVKLVVAWFMQHLLPYRLHPRG